MKALGGALVVEALKRYGIDTLFTLSGGHLFPIYDACLRRGIRIIDTRHEQSAVFAAEGLAKLTRRPAVAALTAGPGVTNGVSAIATARFGGSPLVVLGGRAPQVRWGSGSLQEMDHIPVLASITKRATTVFQSVSIPSEIDAALLAATSPHRGPVFLDFPVDVLFEAADVPDEPPPVPPRLEPDPEALARIAKLLGRSRAPVLVAGSDVYWGGAWEAMSRWVEAAELPVFLNGLGRGCLPADHRLVFSRARATALDEADLVIVAGTPLDFRLRFGQFGLAEVVHLVDSPEGVARHVRLASSAAGDLGLVFQGLATFLERSSSGQSDRRTWIERLRTEEERKRRAEAAALTADSAPIHPARIYGELRKRLDRDAVVIGDGGDFVSFAGWFIDSYLPGRWVDAGPFGCLGAGLGYAIAARLAHPRGQVVLLVGDGAFGFSGLDFDTLVRFGLPVVAVCSNNGIWGMEKHPMRAMYGCDVAADLQPGCRYDKVVEGLGGLGLLVTRPEEIGPALDRALDSGRPAFVNVLTDPSIAYPRSTSPV